MIHNMIDEFAFTGYNPFSEFDNIDTLRQLCSFDKYGDIFDIKITDRQKEYIVAEYIRELFDRFTPERFLLRDCRHHFSKLITNIDIIRVLNKIYRRKLLEDRWLSRHYDKIGSPVL